MKTQSQTILLSMLVVFCSFAMLPANAQFSAGVRAGANFATEPANDLYHVFLARPYVGVFAQYNLKIPIAFQLGVNYSGEGANYKDLGTGDTYQIRHSFLTIPFLARYTFGFGGYIEAGPQLGFLLSAKERANNDPFEDSKQYYKGTDVSAGGGLGYEVKKGGLRGFGVNLRYMRGLTDLNKTDVGSNDHIKSRVLSLGLTYRLSQAKGK